MPTSTCKIQIQRLRNICAIQNCPQRCSKKLSFPPKEKHIFFLSSFSSIVLSPSSSHLNTTAKKSKILRWVTRQARIVARCKSGFGSIMEGFQNNQALPWEFRDPEKVQRSDYVWEISQYVSFFWPPKKVDRYFAILYQLENGRNDWEWKKVRRRRRRRRRGRRRRVELIKMYCICTTNIMGMSVLARNAL